MPKEIERLLELSKQTAVLAFNKLTHYESDNSDECTYSPEVPRELKAEIDVEIEKIILEQLSPTGISVLSEECGYIEGQKESEFHFVVDPLDGTVNYTRNIASSAISIALFNGDVPVFGVCVVYPSGDLIWGGRNYGSFKNGEKILVSKRCDPSRSVICTGFPSRFEFDKSSINDFINLVSKFSKVRMLGAASISMLQVASGRAEYYAEKEIMLWDVAAGIAIVEGAGGLVTYQPGKSKYSLNVEASNAQVRLEEL